MKIPCPSLLISGVASFYLGLSGCSGPSRNSPEKPNIIFIMADDLGYADLNCYGQKHILTPNIDSMAKRGMCFRNMYAGSAVSAPSRSVLMTGMHTGHTFVRGNKEVDPYGQEPLPDTVITVAELLKTAGYKTALIGKWGLGVENGTGDPQGQGFDEFYGYYCQVHAHNSFPEYLYHDGKKEYLRNKVKYRPADDWTRGLGGYAIEKKDFSNDLFCQEALNYIDYTRDKTFFLYLSLTIPHINGEAPAGEQYEVPDLGIYADSAWTPEEKAYAALITRMDTYVGRIAEKLKALGIDKKTLLIFTSDNGAEKMDIFNSNGINRGLKRDVYEGGIKIPFIAVWPGVIPDGRTSSWIGSFQDFLPTVCELGRVKVPYHTDGISMVQELKGHPEQQKTHPYLYWEFHEGGGKQGVRMQNWKGVKLNVDKGQDQPLEVYDLDSDPAELHNLADSLPSLVQRMDSLLYKAHVKSPEFPFEWEK